HHPVCGIKRLFNTITMMNEVTGIEETVRCANMFERIGRVEKDKWMPYYYAAYALVVLSYDVGDMTERDEILDIAQGLLDSAMYRAPDESEIYVLQAFLYPSRILVDPTGRGMIYVEKIFQSIEKAKILNPDNPRTYFLEAVNRLNMPPSIGGGPEVAKPIFEMAAQKYQAFQTDDPLWPTWGKEENRIELEKLEKKEHPEETSAGDDEE
ncbi:MAG: hypothetical protein ACWGNV_17475, partial [Bacteroidales bacterium]